MSQVRVYGKFSKVEQQADGTLRVEGIASTESRDSSGEIIKADAMRRALPDYMKFPTLREMHETWAAGRTVGANVDQDGITRIRAKVVDAEAIKKVKEKVYNGFSIGGSVKRRNDDDASIIEELDLTEISLVDRPANPDCVMQLIKIQNGVTMPATQDSSKQETATQDQKVAAEPKTTTKVEASASLKKMLGGEVWDAKMAIEALSIITALLSIEQSENHPEGADQISDLISAIQAIKSFIASEIMESDEPSPSTSPEQTPVEASAKTGDLAKGYISKEALKVHKEALEQTHKALREAADKFKAMADAHKEATEEHHASIGKIHKALKKLHKGFGEKPSAEDAEDEGSEGEESAESGEPKDGESKDAAAKVGDLTKRLTDAELAASTAGEALAKLMKERDELAARLAAKGSVRVVEKADDTGTATREKQEEPKDTVGLIKLAQSRPINRAW